ncbi:MAG: hypothetical protein WCL11_24175 [Verrucomicrobiota bacterium]
MKTTLQNITFAGLIALMLTCCAQTLAASAPSFSVTGVYREESLPYELGTDYSTPTPIPYVFKINASIPLTIDLQDVDEATHFSCFIAESSDIINGARIGDLSGILGQDPKYVVGKTSATFSEPGKQITLSWSASTLNITGTFNGFMYSGSSTLPTIIPWGQQASFNGLCANGIQVGFGAAHLVQFHPYAYSGTNNVKDTGRTDGNGNPVLLNNGRILITADFAPPSLAVATPRANSTVTSDFLPLISFSARDPGGLGDIPFQVFVNGGPVDVSTSSSAPTNAAGACYSIGLQPGTNAIQILAYDSSGNVASTNLNVFYSVSMSASDFVFTNGTGTIKGLPTTGKVELGRDYKLTAAPGAGQIFVGWNIYYQGSLWHSDPSNPCVVRFYEGMEAEATFVANPYPALAGTYNGLFQGDPLDRQTAGAIAITTSSDGSFSGKVTMANTNSSFSGKFLYDQTWAYAEITVVISGRTDWLMLYLGMDPGDSASYAVMAGDIFFQDSGADALFTAGRYVTLPQTTAGVWNFIVAPVAGDDTGPNGYSFGTLTVRTNGTATGTVTVADSNAPVTITAGVAFSGTVPVFASLYSGAGFMAISGSGTNIDMNYPTNMVECGTAAWFKGPGKAFYTNGFSAPGLAIQSAKYVPRPAGTYSGTIYYGGAGLAEKMKEVSIQNGTIKVTDAGGNEDSLAGTVTWSTGAFSGSFKEGSVSRTFKGIMVGYNPDGIEEGAGFFIRTNQSGAISLTIY